MNKVFKLISVFCFLIFNSRTFTLSLDISDDPHQKQIFLDVERAINEVIKAFDGDDFEYAYELICYYRLKNKNHFALLEKVYRKILQLAAGGDKKAIDILINNKKDHNFFRALTRSIAGWNNDIKKDNNSLNVDFLIDGIDSATGVEILAEYLENEKLNFQASQLKRRLLLLLAKIGDKRAQEYLIRNNFIQLKSKNLY